VTQASLRRGWTTGSCATAAAKAAWTALTGHGFPDPVTITLPGGQGAAFALAETGWHGDAAIAGVVKDAGDDPDVTHGALVRAILRRGVPGSGIVFRAGEGVGTVTRPGLPLPPGEPAINPVPRRMIQEALGPVDAVVEIAIPGGAALAGRTLNGRLGIVGGLSILGTTGIVVPFSCAHRCRARDRIATCGGRDRPGVGAGCASAAWAARDGADRNGRFRGRHAEIPP
jgi:cobalt-precorrin-5B (C1)-methyltransferase